MIKFERSELAIFGLPDLSRSFGSAIKTDTCHFRKFLWSDRCSYFLAVLILLSSSSSFSSSSDYRFCPCQWTVISSNNKVTRQTHNFNDLTTIIWKTIRERSRANITPLDFIYGWSTNPRLTYPPRKKAILRANHWFPLT